MADVRSLLRQQRAARRIEHPYAAYSDAGKLLCTLCHEQIKTESLWDSHVQSSPHRSHVQKLQQHQKETNDQPKDGESGTGAGTGARVVAGLAPQQKRKHDDDDGDVDMTEDAIRRKRSKADMSKSSQPPDVEGGKDSRDQNLTPPRGTRRTSTTPSQGIGMQIPSRPATPAHRSNSTASTPSAVVTSQSGGATATLPSRQPSMLATEKGDAKPASAAPDVDESEWAAFEADIAAVSAPYDDDAVISAPAMNAEEAAAAVKAEEEAAEQRRSQVDVDLEDEKEEAKRALEEEFEEMEELEARVQRLKEKREALRKQGGSFGQEGAAAKPVAPQKENLKTPVGGEDEDDDDDDQDDQDFDGFGFWST